MEKDILEKIKRFKFVAGCDEAGAGCGAGNLLVAAVIFEGPPPLGLADSKKLSEKSREKLFEDIMKEAKDVSIISVSPQKIDEINILQARMLGFSLALYGLEKVDYAIIDGNRLPKDAPCPMDFLVKGDSLFPSIMAASIVAKVTRDREMLQAEKDYPGYGFAKHKGYLTKLHLDALSKMGPCPIHRLSYKPVANASLI